MSTDSTVAQTDDTASLQWRLLLLLLIYWCEVFMWNLGDTHTHTHTHTQRLMTRRETGKHCPALSGRRMDSGIS